MIDKNPVDFNHELQIVYDREGLPESIRNWSGMILQLRVPHLYPGQHERYERECREAQMLADFIFGILEEFDLELIYQGWDTCSDHKIMYGDPCPICKIEEMEDRKTGLKELINEQANDEALWFEAGYGPEGMLQQALRRLHTEVEKHIHND